MFDGSGVEFVDLNVAAAFGLKGAEEAEVVIAGGFQAADDGGVGAAEGACGHEGGGDSSPAFRGVGEGGRRA